MDLFKADLRAAGLELEVSQLDAVVVVLTSELFSCAEDLIGAQPMSSLDAVSAMGVDIVVALQQVDHCACGLVSHFGVLV